MPRPIDVDFDGMDHAVQQLRTYAQNMQHELDGLTRHLDVLSRQWSGAAYDAYREAQLSWDNLMGQSTESLNDAADQLAAAKEAYEDNEYAVIRECV